MTDNKEKIYLELKELANQMAAIINTPDLNDAFKQQLPESLDYNSGHLKAIEENATPTLKNIAFGKWDADSPREERLARISLTLHEAFTDPIAKVSQNISNGVAMEMDTLVLKNLDDAKKCILDITFNAHKIFYNGMPTAINKATVSYERLIPKIEAAFSKLNEFQDSPYEANPDKNYYDGKNHLRRMPDDFILLPEATVEVSPELHKKLLDIATEVQTTAEDLKIIDLDYQQELRKYTEAAKKQRLAGEGIDASPPKHAPVLVEALRSAFEQKEFSAEQMQAIEGAATPPLSNIIERKDLGDALAHSYLDPFKKALNALTENIDIGEYGRLPKNLGHGIQCLDDIIGNYPKLLSGVTMPEIVKDTLEGYKEILEKLEDAFDLADAEIKVPYTLSANTKPDEGKDHLNALPENFVTLGLEPPIPSGP